MTDDAHRHGDDDELARRRIAYALELFGRAWHVHGTTAGAFYLAMRGLSLPAELDGPVVRFHPRCPRGRERAPALVVLFRDLIDDVPRAIQRIYIGRDYRKDGKPMMLGPVGGCAMKLGPRGPKLCVCEGFETGLALIMLGYGPVWALGSAGALARLPVLDGVEELVVAYDNDLAGKMAASVVLETWRARATPITVDREGCDFADVCAERMGTL